MPESLDFTGFLTHNYLSKISIIFLTPFYTGLFSYIADTEKAIEGETASLSGTLTVVATGADFVSLTDDDFGVDVTGCCVGGPESSGTAAALYEEYQGLGGQ